MDTDTENYEVNDEHDDRSSDRHYTHESRTSTPSTDLSDARIGRGFLGIISVVAAAVVGGIVLDFVQRPTDTTDLVRSTVTEFAANLNQKERDITALEADVEKLRDRVNDIAKSVHEIDATVDDYRGALAQGKRFTDDDWNREDRRLIGELQNLQRQIDAMNDRLRIYHSPP